MNLSVQISHSCHFNRTCYDLFCITHLATSFACLAFCFTCVVYLCSSFSFPFRWTISDIDTVSAPNLPRLIPRIPFLKVPDGSGPVQDGFLGIEVSKEPPHRVLEIDDLLDANCVRQGEPGYSNTEVLPGDRLIAIDGKPAERVPVRAFRFEIVYHNHSACSSWCWC